MFVHLNGVGCGGILGCEMQTPGITWEFGFGIVAEFETCSHMASLDVVIASDVIGQANKGTG